MTIPAPLTCDGMPCHVGVLNPRQSPRDWYMPPEFGPFPVVMQQVSQQMSKDNPGHILAYWKFPAPHTRPTAYEPRQVPIEAPQ